MHIKRHGNTGQELVNSGAWVKVGRKHYRHVTGVEVVYDCNRWGWRIMAADGTSDGLVWSTLWVAAHYATKATEGR